MSISTVALIGLLVVMLPTIYNFVTNSLNIMSTGIDFITWIFTTIPNFLFNDFIPKLPLFFQSAFYGLLGFMLFILATKIILSIK